jgi:hypothetical protein
VSLTVPVKYIDAPNLEEPMNNSALEISIFSFFMSITLA